MQNFVPQIMPHLIIIIQLAIAMACIRHIHQGKIRLYYIYNIVSQIIWDTILYVYIALLP